MILHSPVVRKCENNIGKLNAPQLSTNHLPSLYLTIISYSIIQIQHKIKSSQKVRYKKKHKYHFGTKPPPQENNSFYLGLFLRCKNKDRVNWLRFKAAGWLFTPTFLYKQMYSNPFMIHETAAQHLTPLGCSAAQASQWLCARDGFQCPPGLQPCLQSRGSGRSADDR